MKQAMPRTRAKDRPKRPDSKALAKPKALVVKHAGKGRNSIMKARLDRRSRAYRTYAAEIADLTSHLGNAPTAVQARLIEQAARLALLEHIAWAELTRIEALTQGGNVHAAFEPYIKAARDRRAVLTMLGLERKARDVTLQDVLEGSVERDE